VHTCRQKWYAQHSWSARRNYSATTSTNKRETIAMGQQVLTANESHRNAGRAAIASGVIGIVAYGFLRTAVSERMTWIPPTRIYILFGAHDIGVALQFLLLISVALGLKKLSHQTPPSISKAAFTTGVASPQNRGANIGYLCRLNTSSRYSSQSATNSTGPLKLLTRP
jgi:hypothetical protein